MTVVVWCASPCTPRTERAYGRRDPIPRAPRRPLPSDVARLLADCGDSYCTPRTEPPVGAARGAVNSCNLASRRILDANISRHGHRGGAGGRSFEVQNCSPSAGRGSRDRGGKRADRRMWCGPRGLGASLHAFMTRRRTPAPCRRKAARVSSLLSIEMHGKLDHARREA